jgi:hypothetical protein
MQSLKSTGKKKVKSGKTVKAENQTKQKNYNSQSSPIPLGPTTLTCAALSWSTVGWLGGGP